MSLEAKVEALTEANVALTEAVTTLTAAIRALECVRAVKGDAPAEAPSETKAEAAPSEKKTRAGKADKADKAEKVEKAEKTKSAEKSGKYSRAEMNAAINEVKEEMGINFARAILKDHGFERLADVTDDKIDEIYMACQVALRDGDDNNDDGL